MGSVAGSDIALDNLLFFIIIQLTLMHTTFENHGHFNECFSMIIGPHIFENPKFYQIKVNRFGSSFFWPLLTRFIQFKHCEMNSKIKREKIIIKNFILNYF